MAQAGAPVNESFVVAGRVGAEVSRELALAIGSDSAYRTAVVGPDTYQYVRSYRPTWAVVTGWVTTVLLCGGGLLFFLVKRSESCTISVVDGPRGAVVTIAGRLLPDALARARGASDPGARAEFSAHAGSNAVRPTEATRPPQPEVLAAAAQELFSDETLHARSSAGRPLLLRFDSGECVPLVGDVVVGRDPVATPPATPVAIADTTFTVSKTHFAVRARAGRLAVADLHSTNGTRVIDLGGGELDLTGGATADVEPGATVLFGDRRVEVIDG